MSAPVISWVILDAAHKSLRKFSVWRAWVRPGVFQRGVQHHLYCCWTVNSAQMFIAGVFGTKSAVFHTTSFPDGICLNKTSRIAASLLDKDVFVFSLLSLWSSSVKEEKSWMWHLSPFYKTVKMRQNIYQEQNFSTEHNSLHLLLTPLPFHH